MSSPAKKAANWPSTLCLMTVAALLGLGACNTSTPSTVTDMANLPGPDLNTTDLLPPTDMLLPIITYDGSAPTTNSVYCGSQTKFCSGATPYCCYATLTSNDGTCVSDVSGCARSYGCATNEDCPGSHPFCCADHPPNVDCRASCEHSICRSDLSCPPEHPTCFTPGLEALGMCQ